MGRNWVAIGAGAIVAAGIALGRPHRVTAAPDGPDQDRIGDPLARHRLLRAPHCRRLARRRGPVTTGLPLSPARPRTGNYADYDRAARLARRSLDLRESHNAETYTAHVGAAREASVHRSAARGQRSTPTTPPMRVIPRSWRRSSSRSATTRARPPITVPSRSTPTNLPSPLGSRGGTRSRANCGKRRRSCASRPLGWPGRATSLANNSRGFTTGSVSSTSAADSGTRPTPRSIARSPRCQPTTARSAA